MRACARIALPVAVMVGLGTAVRADVGEPRDLIADLAPAAAPSAGADVETAAGRNAAGGRRAHRDGSLATAATAVPVSDPNHARILEKALRARGDGNHALALLMLLPLAQQGEPRAAYHLGLMYEYGLGVERNDAEALEWHRRAAERGHAAGQYSLGLMYFDGRGAGPDPEAAARWIARAAERGFAPAQYGLGLLHFNGIGVERDLVRAHMWFELAAARGNQSGRENRDTLARQLTSEQLIQARQLASLWMPKRR